MALSGQTGIHGKRGAGGRGPKRSRVLVMHPLALLRPSRAAALYGQPPSQTLISMSGHVSRGLAVQQRAARSAERALANPVGDSRLSSGGRLRTQRSVTDKELANPVGASRLSSGGCLRTQRSGPTRQARNPWVLPCCRLGLLIEGSHSDHQSDRSLVSSSDVLVC